MSQRFSGTFIRYLATGVAGGLLVACGALLPQAARADVTTLTIHDAARSEATSPDVALTIARRRLASHDADAAVAGLERYLSVYPQELVVRRFLGNLYFRAGDFQRAEATYREIVESSPYDSEAHHRLGMLDLMERHLDDAIREFSAGLPESIDDLVIAHQLKGDVDAFEHSMERLAANRPSDAAVQYELGETYDDLRLPYDAVTYFKRAIAIYPASVDYLNALAIAQMQVHDEAAAERTFVECLARDAGNYACTNDLGSLYIDQKRYDAAWRELSRAHDLAPEGPEALVNLGYLADERGDRGGATVYYAQAIYVWPYTPDAYVDLAFDEVQQGAIGRAEAALIQGLAVAPNDTRLHYLRGVVDQIRGKGDEAVAEFRVAERSSDPAIANSARASIGDIEAARATSAGARPAQPPPSPHR